MNAEVCLVSLGCASLHARTNVREPLVLREVGERDRLSVASVFQFAVELVRAALSQSLP
jgi:hypothetical protein